MSVLVARPAPDFTAPAVMPNGVMEEKFSLSQLRGKYIVLFFWPLDFTFVCPTEIIAHDKRVAQFKERGAEVVGVSIDSQFTHFAWRNTAMDDGGIGPVGFPIVADIRHDITRAYGIEHPDGVVVRVGHVEPPVRPVEAPRLEELRVGAVFRHAHHGGVDPLGRVFGCEPAQPICGLRRHAHPDGDGGAVVGAAPGREQDERDEGGGQAAHDLSRIGARDRGVKEGC